MRRSHWTCGLAAAIGMLGTSQISAAVISVPAGDNAALAAAIDYANAHPGEDWIELAANALHAFGRPGDTAEVALPAITSAIRILGNGAELRAVTDELPLILRVAESGRLRLEHLTLGEGARGAIENRGELTLRAVGIENDAYSGADAVVANYGTIVAGD